MPRIPTITASGQAAVLTLRRHNLADLLGAKRPFAAHPIASLLGASLKEIENERTRAVLDLLT